MIDLLQIKLRSNVLRDHIEFNSTLPSQMIIPEYCEFNISIEWERRACSNSQYIVTAPGHGNTCGDPPSLPGQKFPV